MRKDVVRAVIVVEEMDPVLLPRERFLTIVGYPKNKPCKVHMLGL